METTELYRTQFVPVILGSGIHARKTARRLFWKYGLSSHLLATHIPLAARLCPWVICHKLTSPVSSELTLLALTDLAAEIEAADRTPLLCLGGHESPLSDEIMSALESNYILCRDDGLPEKGQEERAV